MEIFTREGGEILSRWGHYMSGVTWIGLLYYFNFVQVPAFATFEAGPRTEALTKLAPRALWWFRWAAVATVATGLLIIGTKPDQEAYWDSSTGVAISTGILIALIMFANVWGIIWRNQKIVIASAERVAAGGEADPAAAAAGRKALVASRTNTLFSIPMLFFMGAASHFAGVFNTGDNRGAYYGVMTLIVVLVELNAVGVFGGVGPSPLRKYADSHRDTIIAGFALWVVLYLLWEIFF